MPKQQQGMQHAQAAWLLLLLLQLVSLQGLQASIQPDSNTAYAAGTDTAVHTGAFNQRGSSSSSSSSESRFGHIITLRHDPLISFRGDESSGLVATAAASSSGGKLDVTTAAATAYTSYLQAASVSVASRASIAASSITYNYHITTTGFAVADQLSQQQLDALRRDPEVLSVTENKIFSVRTLSTPAFLGLAGTGKNGRGGVWDQLGGQFGGPARAGENVVVGIIDTGEQIVVCVLG
jgi:hypothetical protein